MIYLRYIVSFFSFVAISWASEYSEILDIIDNTYIYTVTATGSMEPAFNEHYYLLVKKIPYHDTRIGDVILANEPCCDIPVCHRIIRKSGGGSLLVLKGDNNLTPDRFWITESQYIGIVVGIIRKP